jgi:putative ABC transport system permease protein
VVVGVALVVSTLTILLAMYTSVTERTREIGILKALGASKPFIVFTIEKEALAISVFGVIAGYVIARLAQLYIVNATKLKIVFEPHWMIFTILVGLSAGLIGALYPAIRAAWQDAVVALNYE